MNRRELVDKTMEFVEKSGEIMWEDLRHWIHLDGELFQSIIEELLADKKINVKFPLVMLRVS